jgi:DNA-binding transcriptional ArsR family regulator
VAAAPAVWTALADPHRRAALELLLERPRSVAEVMGELRLSQPSTSKHLRVLRDAGLVSVRRDGQRRIYAVRPQPLAELHAWLGRYRALWDGSLDALERRLDETEPREEPA